MCQQRCSECAEELGFIYQHIFQRTIEEHTIPSIWKASIIVPFPKKSNPSVLNDYRPVALTSIAMKCLEKLVLRQIMVHTESKLDEYQFAYRHGKSVEDAVLTLLHRIYKHVDQLNSYVRILFIDYSSAFNTIQPHIMIRKLLELNVPADIHVCLWVLNFLSDRTQTVRIGNKHSSVLTLNTGAPQGCVLSPVLFILYTDTLCATDPGCVILKYADDTAVLGEIRMSDESVYRNEIKHVVNWCNENHLVLNASKTKELIIDLRKRPLCQYPVVMGDTCVNVVRSYKYLGMVIDDRLSWYENSDLLYKKGRKRLYFLRKLNSFHIDNELLSLFYSAMVQSVICYGLVCWWSCLLNC